MDRAKQHFVQDALEAYAVAKLTKLAEQDNMAINNDSDEKYQIFYDYCEERDIDTRNDHKVYGKMYKDHLPVFWNNLKTTFPNCKFDFIDVEKDFRNIKKKGDFVVRIEGETNRDISFSLKAYKGGISRIQVCSGTFNSFITNFLFTPDGVGMYLTENGTRFKGSNVEQRDNEIINIGKESMLEQLHQIDKINPKVKEYFVYGDKAENFLDVEQDWEDWSREYGYMGIDLTIDILNNNFTNQEVKDRIVKMIGFDGEEELLLLDKKRVVDSITNEKLYNIIHKIREQNTEIKFYRHRKSIRFDFVNNDEVLLSVEVPFTLQKNGGWFLPKDKKGAFYKKENMFLEYGQRRPKKSKEINTSINTYVNLGGSGIFQ